MNPQRTFAQLNCHHSWYSFLLPLFVPFVEGVLYLHPNVLCGCGGNYEEGSHVVCSFTDSDDRFSLCVSHRALLAGTSLYHHIFQSQWHYCRTTPVSSDTPSVLVSQTVYSVE